MKKSDYNIQLAEILLRREEERQAKRRRYLDKIVTPAWYVGMTAAYLHSLMGVFGFRGLRSIAFLIYITSFIVFLEVWKYPSYKCVRQLLESFESDRGVVKGLILFLAIPIFSLFHILVGFILVSISGWI